MGISLAYSRHNNNGKITLIACCFPVYKIKSMVAHHRSINSIARRYGVEWETVRTYIDKHMK